MMSRSSLASLSLALLGLAGAAVACSESNDDPPANTSGNAGRGGSGNAGASGAGGGAAGAPGASGGAGAPGASGGAGAGGGAGQGGAGGGSGGVPIALDPALAQTCGVTVAASASIVVNEINGEIDTVELLNITSAPVTLTGKMFVDEIAEQKSPEQVVGCPKLAGEELTFGEFTIPPGGLAVVVAGDPAADACNAYAVPCVTAAFGLSGGAGDAIFILSSDKATVETYLKMPGDPDVLYSDTNSYCRKADGAYSVCEAASFGTPNPL